VWPEQWGLVLLTAAAVAVSVAVVVTVLTRV
jgi:hypothetical protein